MKRKIHPIFTSAYNAATHALNAASGVFQELTLPEGTTELRFRLSPYGEFPVDDLNGKPIIQVIDREAAQTLAANFASLRGKLATFFRGVPIYEGHADDSKWVEKNPGHRASAVGRIKSIEAGDDGIYVTSALNSDGVSLLGGDAPKYTGQSPYWRLAEIKGRPGHFRPVLLWSTALTNTPNIMFNAVAMNSLQGVEMEVEINPSPDAGSTGQSENQETNTDHDDMKLTAEALKALGFAPDAEPTAEEISAAIIKLASDQAEAKAKQATAEGETTAANSRITALQTEITSIRGAAVDTVITEAINTGRITEADRQKWTDALNTDFAGESTKIGRLMPVLNTGSKIPTSLDRRGPAMTDAANAVSSITDAVRAFATEKGIDISTVDGWDRAYAGTKAAKPDLFTK